MLSTRAQAMLDTLPDYWRDGDLLERMIQAQASEVDRLDALVDQIKIELQPGAATDTYGLLAIWEELLDLPPAPTDATLAQRQAKIDGALQALGAASAADTLSVLAAAIGSGAFTVTRDSPGLRQDTLAVPFDSTSYSAGVVVRLARRKWPAHRQLFVDFAGGFLFDTTPFDEASA